MKKKMISLYLSLIMAAAAIVLSPAAIPVEAGSASQEISLSASDPIDNEVAVTVTYDVGNASNTLTALGARIHFDASVFEYTGYTDFFEFGKLADPQLQDDTENRDRDDRTDKLILIGYASPFNKNWPSEPLPLDLITLWFTVKDDADASASEINVSKVTGQAGYSFVGRGTAVSTEAVDDVQPVDDTPDTEDESQENPDDTPGSEDETEEGWMTVPELETEKKMQQ